MKNLASFSWKDKSKKLKCRLLQFLFGALRVNIACSSFGSQLSCGVNFVIIHALCYTFVLVNRLEGGFIHFMQSRWKISRENILSVHPKKPDNC